MVALTEFYSYWEFCTMVIWCFMIKCSTSTRIQKNSRFSKTVLISADDDVPLLQIPKGLYNDSYTGIFCRLRTASFSTTNMDQVISCFDRSLSLLESIFSLGVHVRAGSTVCHLFMCRSSFLRCRMCYVQSPQKPTRLGLPSHGRRRRMQQFVFYLGRGIRLWHKPWMQKALLNWHIHES